MNIYFLDPKYVNTEKFPVLLDILKVKRVIDLIEPVDWDMNLFNAYGPIAIFIRKDTNIEFVIKNAVYKFNEQMCKAVFENGKLTGRFITNNLYSQSNAYNPIFNLEECNDDNTLVLYSKTESEDTPLNFTNLSLNILKKHASLYSYEKRLCFTFIDPLFEYSSMFGEKNFCILYRSTATIKDKHEELKPFITYNTSRVRYIWKSSSFSNDFNKNTYNPLLSYLYIKYKNNYQLTNPSCTLTDVFVTNEGKEELRKRVLEKFQNYVQKVNQRILRRREIEDDICDVD